MTIKVLNIDGIGKSQTLTLPENLISLKVNNRLLKYVVDWQLNRSKKRIAKTKQRNEVVGSTRKIYAQKGTGGARHSSRKAPIFVGGGVAHGPKGENSYKKRKLNKKEKKLGLKSIISEKKNLKDLIIFNDFEKAITKTKEMYSLLKKFEATNSILILDKSSNKNIGRSLKNIPNVKVSDAANIALYDLVKHKKIIFTESSIKDLEKKYI